MLEMIVAPPKVIFADYGWIVVEVNIKIASILFGINSGKSDVKFCTILIPKCCIEEHQI